MTVKPTMKQVPSPNHSIEKGYPMIAIVDHIMSGTLSGTDSWFSQSASQVSSHFGVGKNGEIHQYVDTKYPAWANGVVQKPNWSLLKAGVNPNYYTISIEHEGESGDTFTEAQYQATLALHRWLTDEFNIPVTTDNIIGHYRIDSVNKANCPGTGFPWDRLFKDLKGDEGVKVAILCFTIKDIGAGLLLAEKFGQCAIYFRNSDKTFNADVMKAETLYTVGGTAVGHKNEKVLSGNDAKGTLQAVIAVI